MVPREYVRRTSDRLRPVLDPEVDERVFKAVSKLADQPQFLLLGAPYHGLADVGFSAAFPYKLNIAGVPGRHRFAFISVTNGDKDDLPRLAFHGFADVSNVLHIESKMINQAEPSERIEVGDVLTARQLFTHHKGGWSHYG